MWGGRSGGALPSVAMPSVRCYGQEPAGATQPTWSLGHRARWRPQVGAEGMGGSELLAVGAGGGAGWPPAQSSPTGLAFGLWPGAPVCAGWHWGPRSPLQLQFLSHSLTASQSWPQAGPQPGPGVWDASIQSVPRVWPRGARINVACTNRIRARKRPIIYSINSTPVPELAPRPTGAGEPGHQSNAKLLLKNNLQVGFLF